MKPNAEPAIRVHDLTKKFGDFTAVNDINFNIDRSQIFGFLGPNGSGKTTTIRMLLGLLQPTSGHVEVLGIPVATHAHQIRPRVGYMSQRFTLYNDLTVMQNLRFYGHAYGLRNKKLTERINYVLNMSGLTGREQSKTKELSGGWRQRLALGAAIIHQPELIFLDEPTAGVDPVSRRAFWDLLYHLVGEGITVFVTTHYMDEAEHCHKLAFIQHGSIIASGTPQTIKQETISGKILELECNDPSSALEILKNVKSNFPIQEITLYGALIHIQIRRELNDLNRLQKSILNALKNAGQTSCSINVIEPSLEDVFIARMESDQTLNVGGRND
jgi:ABC-2 type transport system ATP-binding protein